MHCVIISCAYHEFAGCISSWLVGRWFIYYFLFEVASGFQFAMSFHYVLDDMILTLRANYFCRYVCLKGHPVTIVTPGDKVPEILRCVQVLLPPACRQSSCYEILATILCFQALGPMFEQTCLLGYPPFVKGCVHSCRASRLRRMLALMRRRTTAVSSTPAAHKALCGTSWT